MPPLKIRQRLGFVFTQLLMALFLIFLSLYTGSNYRLILGVIWLLIGLNSLRNNSILEVTEKELLVRNGLGMISKRFAYKEGEVEVRGKKIFINQQKIYSHSFFFVEEDFEN